MTVSSADRGAVLAAILVSGVRAPDVLARLAPPRGERCAEAARRLLALDTEARVRELTALARVARAETPANLHLVHASWLDDAVAGETDGVRAAVAGGGTAAPSVRAWLRRRAFGSIVAMPVEHGDSLAARPPAELALAIETIGRRRLAIAVQAAPPGAAAALAARLGPTHGKPFAAEVRAVAAREQQGLAVRELSDLVSAPDDVLFRAGARHLGPALAAPAEGDLARQIAQRLPRPRGLIVLAEAAARREPIGAPLAALHEYFVASARG